jgi:hypothetical protein
MKNFFNKENLYKLLSIFFFGLIIRLLINNINNLITIIYLLPSFLFDNQSNYMLLTDIKKEFIVHYSVNEFPEIPNIFNTDNGESSNNQQQNNGENSQTNSGKSSEGNETPKELFDQGYIPVGRRWKNITLFKSCNNRDLRDFYTWIRSYGFNIMFNDQEWDEFIAKLKESSISPRVDKDIKQKILEALPSRLKIEYHTYAYQYPGGIIAQAYCKENPYDF